MTLLKQLTRLVPNSAQQCRMSSNMIIESINDNTDAVINPSREYIESHWEIEGKRRPDFKPNDFEMWTKGCTDFKLAFNVVKGTKMVIGTHQNLLNHPLSKDGEIFMSSGLLWVHEKYRTKENYIAMVKNAMKHGFNQINTTGCMVPGSVNFWTKMTGGFNVFVNYFISYYKIEDVQIPTDLNYPDIIVKNAKQCPPDDYVNYDRKLYQYDRSKYIIGQFNDPDGYSRVAYDEAGNVIGMGAVIIYPSGECCITPMYAENYKVAQMIFKSILEEMPLKNEKLWRFQIRSNDKCKDSFEWIEPFIKQKIEKTVLSHAVYTRKIPAGLDATKVFINSHPTNYPI